MVHYINPKLETSNCNPDAYDRGGKGTTVWFSEDITIPSSGSFTWTFTDTRPCNYDDEPNNYNDGTQVCLATYEIATEDSSNLTVKLHRFINSHDVGWAIHSMTAGNNVTEAFDLINSHFYNSGGQNSYTFENNSDIPVQIKNLRIVRAYAILGLNQQTSCDDPEDVEANGNLDYTRQDFPCNYDSYGNRISFTPYDTNRDVTTIAPNSFEEWQFTNPSGSSETNYVDRYACFINFNQVDRAFDLHTDLHYRVKCNDHVVADYYHAGIAYTPLWSQFPTVDLAKSPHYDDHPGATNVIRLENLGTEDIILNNGTYGGVDIYRFYKVTNICQDNFNPDSKQTQYLWSDLSNNEGSVDITTNNQLQVTVPANGSGWSQAGKLTRHTCDTQTFYPGTNQHGIEASIDVADFNAPLDQMVLMLGNTQMHYADPTGQSYWYRIAKARRGTGTTNALVVEKRQNSSPITLLNTPWIAPTGQLKIKTSTGSIAFYENGFLRYAEPYDLPEDTCYSYIYTSSERPDHTGTAAFDNFSIIPAQNYRSNFGSGAYGEWTPDNTNNWCIQNGRLQSTESTSHIYHTDQFLTNRHVRADIQTISRDGTNEWNVAWLMIKEQDGDNKIYALIRTDGKVELTMYYQGQRTFFHQVQSSNPTLNPFDPHAIAVSIIGNNAKVWVDGHLYIDENHEHFDDIAGWVGFYSYSSTAAINNIAIFDGPLSSPPPQCQNNQGWYNCQSCYDGWETCAPCYGFCQTCNAFCEMCESSYNWCQLCESGYDWPSSYCVSGYNWCELCESAYNWCALCQNGYSYWPCDICETCYSCNTVCEVCEESCQVSCQDCYTACQPCNNCQTACQLGCQMCYELCYDCQDCYSCQEGCYACEDCYGAYTP